MLAALAGPGARLRPDQEEAVAGLLAPGARVLVVQATGWGKSAVYWVAAAVLRSRGLGPALVVSPLLSLMRDQVAAARRAGLVAQTLNSANRDEWDLVEAELAADRVDVLLVSPERLANPVFGRRVLDRLTGRLGLLVIDEAHAVSDWGHDFRPDYRRVADVLRHLNPQTPVLATTATANARVTTDVAAQLGPSTLVQRGPLARSSLDLAVIGGLDPLARYAWIVEHLPALPGSGIVYTLTVADAERLTAAITARHGEALPVAAYTGSLDGGLRERLEDDLRGNRLKALVATSALGMGYDKPDLGFVVHVGAPPSPVSYYQQVGRAGRAIDRALVALLPAAADDRVWEYFATATLPVPAEVDRLLAALPGPGEPAASGPALEAETGLRRTKVELLLKQLAVAEVVDRDVDGWRTTGRPWHYDAEHYAAILATRRREADLMRQYVAGRSCLMALLQTALDDPSAAPCGRCSVCRGELLPGWSAAPAPATVEAVRRVLRERSHTLEPRKMWPGGAFGARGRIPADLGVEPGRVLVHADAPEWQAALTGSLTGADPAVPAEPELLAAAVAALVSWRPHWPQRPGAIVAFDAARVGQVAAQVAEHLGAVGRLPVQRWTWTGTPPSREASSADQAAAWRDLVQADPPPATDADSVLLVVDASASGWAITLAGAALRRAGARVVLPLLVHRPL
ncbi:MAG: DEAD/DEAH box helicase [Austwickia sp.]|nr:DEAD/DEAH box helicase [Austwickia sp.]